METVYDYNITEEEKKYIGILDKEEYHRILDQTCAYMDLVYLFHLRGDIKTAKEYSQKLPPYMQVDIWRTILHP